MKNVTSLMDPTTTDTDPIPMGSLEVLPPTIPCCKDPSPPINFGAMPEQDLAATLKCVPTGERSSVPTELILQQDTSLATTLHTFAHSRSDTRLDTESKS